MATDRKPTHIVVVCSASRWGDYFIGSTSSVLVVDDLELIYDRLDKPVNRYIRRQTIPPIGYERRKPNAESAALSNKKAGNHSLLFCSVIGLTLSAPSGSELRDPAILIITIHYVLHESPRLTVAGKFAALHDLVLVIGGIGLEFQVAEHHLPGIGVFAVHTGQPPGIIDMTDSTVVAGQDQAHSVFLGNSRRQVERRIDPIPHFIGQQYIGFRIEQGFFRGYVELRATAGMICISPLAPRRETISALKRDS